MMWRHRSPWSDVALSGGNLHREFQAPGVARLLLALAIASLLGISCGEGGSKPAGAIDADITAPVIPPPPPLQQAVQQESTVMVEVQGAVASPGMYTLPSGARLHDALLAAGGATNEADIRDLNIAARLIDGSVISVPYNVAGTPTAGAVNPPAYTRAGWRGSGRAQSQSATSGPPGSGPVELNSATQEQLETLPGVGPKTAEKIIRYRSIQPFTQVDDLRYIQGIGEKRLETLRPLVTVD